MPAHTEPEIMFILIGSVSVVGLLLKDVFVVGVKRLFGVNDTQDECRRKEHCKEHTELLVNVSEIKTNVEWLCQLNGKK